MVSFAHPEAFWLFLFGIPIALFGLWGLRIKKKIASFVLIPIDKIIARHAEKYAILFALGALLVFAVASPRSTLSRPTNQGKTGEIIFLADSTMSMAAKKELSLSSRIDRERLIILEILDYFPEVKGNVCGFSSRVRCFSVMTDDHVYLKRVTERVLGINAVPGTGTNMAGSISNAAQKFSPRERSRTIVLLTDGENHSVWGANPYTDEAVAELGKNSVNLFIVGIGEKEGARIPLYNGYGKFTGYAESGGELYISRLDEKALNALAAAAKGKYFTEHETEKLKAALSEILIERATEEGTREYSNLTYYLLIPITALFIIFARRHFKL